MADAWLEIVHQSRRVRLRRLRNWLLFVVGFITFEAQDLGYIVDPRSVVVARRDTGAAVLTFDHDHVADASEHAESLRHRLATTGFFDFCRELGIPFQVAEQIQPTQE